MARFQITDCTARRAPGRLIRRIEKLMTGVMEQRLESAAINYTQWATLKLIDEGFAPTAGDLAVQLGHTTGAITRLIDGLETLDLLRRERGTDDRRVVRLSVTPAGLAIVDAIKPIVLGAWNEMVEDFDQEEADQLVNSLAKLLSTIERKTGRTAYAEAAE
ncbi:MAG: MarR family transcriptional regulator [Sphingomonas bacterium]|jgi:DNA-binding MarR family transcriptional regulator|nr:MarR family transcriptional regulator [Sphingomonas bacterium]